MENARKRSSPYFKDAKMLEYELRAWGRAFLKMRLSKKKAEA